MYNQKLRAICPQIFPDLLKIQKDDLSTSPAYSHLTGIVKQAQTGLCVHVRPLGDEVSAVMENLSEKEVAYEMHALTGVRDSIVSVREQMRLLEEENKSKSFPEYPVVTLLGTGSASPSKVRNVSAILLETHPGKSFFSYSEAPKFEQIRISDS